MSKLKIMLSAAATLALAGAAVQTAHAAPHGGYYGYDVTRNAVHYTPGVDQRLRNQRRRIRHARRNGWLTRFEARRAHSALIRIHQAKRWAASDGVIERIERRWMHQMLDRNSRRIRRMAKTGYRHVNTTATQQYTTSPCITPQQLRHPTGSLLQLGTAAMFCERSHDAGR
jgi:hypothetical protein